MVLDTIVPISCADKNSFFFYEKIAMRKIGDRGKLLYSNNQKDIPLIHSDLYKRVKRKYEIYDQNVNCLEVLVKEEYSDKEKEALHHCYSSSSVSLKELKTEIINAQPIFYQSKCAYCGIDSIDGMDHYVPKDKFPEYSVHPYNLVPACEHCNGKKSDLFLQPNGDRYFFNPYFDVESSKILDMNIQYSRSNNSFSFKIELNNSSYTQHIDTLNIIKRYSDEAINIFDNLKTEVFSSFHAHSCMYKSLAVYEKNFFKQMKKSRDIKLEERGINSVDFLVYDTFIRSKYCDITFLIQNFADSLIKSELEQLIN